MNVNCIEVGGLSLKEPPQPQSRLSQWTHSNSMDTLGGNTSNLENNLNKHGGSNIPILDHPQQQKKDGFKSLCAFRDMLGAISAASTLGPPGKPAQLEDSYSPYNLMSSSDSPASSLVPPDNWGQGKNPNEKIANGTNINWPPGEDKDK